MKITILITLLTLAVLIPSNTNASEVRLYGFPASKVEAAKKKVAKIIGELEQKEKIAKGESAVTVIQSTSQAVLPDGTLDANPFPFVEVVCDNSKDRNATAEALQKAGFFVSVLPTLNCFLVPDEE